MPVLAGPEPPVIQLTRAALAAALLVIVIASPAAQAGVEGSCSYEGKQLKYVDGVAARAPDPFDDAALVPNIWFATVAFDQGKFAGVPPKDLDDAVTSQIFDHESAELRLRLDATGAMVESLQLYVPPGNNRSISSNEVGTFKLTGTIGARIAGHFKLEDDDLNCDLQFDLPMGNSGKAPPKSATAATAKPAGQPLPAGGGEPGKAYLALHRAVVAGDVDAMIALVDADKAAEMRKARSQADFPKTLEMIQMFEPAEVHVTGGNIDGDNAELTIAGKDSDGTALTGEVKLTRNGGRWQVDKVSTSSKITN
jgi:hypothetical protein